MISHLRCITLTGVDQSTPIDQALALSEQFPLLEWGILLGGRETPRYPSPDFIYNWVRACQLANAKTALHLCGQYARDWIANDPQVVDLANQFGRIQVNVIADRCDLDALVDAIESSRHPDVITQHNVSNRELTLRLLSCSNHSILFDGSGGRGQSPETWPDVIPGKYCGYAGGLGPDNVTQQLPLIAEAAQDSMFWIDMEGKLRTSDDRLDLDLCQAVLSATSKS